MKSPEQELREGVQAQSELDMVKPRLDSIRENLISAWIQSKPSDVDSREELYRYYHTIEQLERDFTRDITTGKMAKHQLGESDSG